MTLRDRLSALVEAADPEGSVILRFAWLAELLSVDNEQPPNAAASSTGVDLTVQQVATLFGRGESTVRTWLAERAFPNAYRLRGREWRIPRSDVTVMQKNQRAQRGVLTCQPQIASVDLGDWRKHANRDS